MLTRRQFLNRSLASAAFVSLGGVGPHFLRNAAAWQAGNGDNILVVIQLSGGNDGLNTVVPFRDDEYRKARPTLAISADQVLKIDDQFGWHPALRGAADLLESQRLAVIQGVGYDQANRSHFESMDIWHTCQRKTDRQRQGWLGRYLESAESGDDAPGLHLGGEAQPLALAARNVRVPSVASLERFRLRAGAAGSIETQVEQLAMAARPQTSDLLGFVQSSTVAALDASQRVEEVVKVARSASEFPATQLGEKLQTVAKLIGAGLRTRVYYVALDGFDTHAQQAAAHAALLGQWSDALRAFLDDLAAQGNDQRVLTLTFSEFGRRVKENASEGTDHGAAAPVFLAGGRVKAGLHGPMPSLTELEDGDQKFHTDFRRVYATILDRWFAAPSAPILGAPYEPLDVLKTDA